MKCALELVAIAKNIQEQKEITKKIQREEKMKELKEKTFSLCNQISIRLEELANNGKTPTLEFICKERWDYSNGLYYNHIMDYTFNKYADGRKSYELVDGGQFIYSVLKEWLVQYCFNIKFEEITVWEYGLGAINVLKVKIFPNPECLK